FLSTIPVRQMPPTAKSPSPFSSSRGHRRQKPPPLTRWGSMACLRHMVELQGEAALLAGSVILMQNLLLDRLVNGLDGSLVSAIGLIAVAFCQSRVELLES